MKFTFRKEAKETGLAGIGRPYANTEIKVNKKYVGNIVAPTFTTQDNKWKIRLQVVTQSPCGWDWISFTARFNDEPSARKWLNDHAEAITAKHTLHLSDS